MDDIRQKRSNEGPNLRLNNRFKKTSLNKTFGTHVKEFYGLSGLEKLNSIAYLEVNLLGENPCQG